MQNKAILDKLEESIDEKGLNKTLFKWCRQFYNMYPQIGATVSHQFGMLIESQKSATVSHEFVTNPECLVQNLSFSHIREIMVLDDDFERYLYFRSGVSNNPKDLLKSSEDNPDGYALSIRDPFTFEFLGLDPSGSLTESELEQGLIDHLQEFETCYLESQNHLNDSKMILFFRKAQEILGASWKKKNRNAEFTSISHEKKS